MTSVDVCRLNKYDNPDLVYGRHDGTILKRLFSAFSFRPTVVATLPVASLFAYNPYSQNIRPTVTSIPMINIRLSSFGQQAAAAAATAGLVGARAPTNSLTAALSQTNQFLEGNSVVNRHTSVMFSREILVFYIDRRSYVYTTGTTLTNLARLPTSIAGFERINDIPIQFEDVISTSQDPNSDQYAFISAVVADVNDTINPAEGGNYVIGSSALVLQSDGVGSRVWHYTPATCISRNSDRPIITIDEEDIGQVMGYRSLLTKRSTILIYVNHNYNDKALIF
jgi:hypothetical protein